MKINSHGYWNGQSRVPKGAYVIYCKDEKGAWSLDMPYFSDDDKEKHGCESNFLFDLAHVNAYIKDEGLAADYASLAICRLADYVSVEVKSVYDKDH